MSVMIPVNWNDLHLMADDGELLSVVTDMTGWYDTPEVDGHNVERVLADGQAPGAKTLGPRVIAITGTAVGPGRRLVGHRDALARLTTMRVPTTLEVVDPDLGSRTALVRADSDSYQQTWVGRKAFHWQVTVTAADPRLFGPLHSLTLTADTGEAGRVYTRTYPWDYGGAPIPNVGWLDNEGNAPAAVTATFTGYLQNIRLTDGTNALLVRNLGQGEVITVDTETLVATAPGGASRAAYILPGSQPLTVPPGGAEWNLYALQGGNVVLNWRSSWL